MERNVLLALLLSFLVLILYQSYLVPPGPIDTEEASRPVESVSSGVSETDNPRAVTTATTPVPLTAAPSEVTDGTGDTSSLDGGELGLELAGITVLVSAEAEQKTTVESDTILATFSNRGAVLTSWKLKNHTEQGGEALEFEDL